MAENFEIALIFALPEGAYDPLALSDSVFEAGFGDALVGTGTAGLLAVELILDGEDAESAILEAARALLKRLPEGTTLHEIRPDLVSAASLRLLAGR